jgi:hypothetical protein
MDNTFQNQVALITGAGAGKKAQKVPFILSDVMLYATEKYRGLTLQIEFEMITETKTRMTKSRHCILKKN